ncbi:MAG: hypothetical protein WA655_17110 [Candidatus Korobacteraceae bacterium]
MNTEVIPASASTRGQISAPDLRWRARDFLALLLLAVVFFILERPTFHDPYYWDSSYPADVANRILHGHMNPAMKDFPDPGHPVLTEELYALGWLVMGSTPAWWPHFVAFALSFLMLLYAYRIGVWLGGSLAGLVGAFLILLDPLFLAESGTIYPAVPAAALAAAAIYYLLVDEPRKFAFAGSLAALTYIPVDIFLCCLIAIAVLLRWRRGPRALFWYVVPGLTLAAWLVFHRLAYGYFISDPAYWKIGQRSMSLSVSHLRVYVEKAFLYPWRLPFTILSFAGGLALVSLMLLNRRAEVQSWVPRACERLGGRKSALLFLILMVGTFIFLPIITATTGVILLGRYLLVLMIPLFLLAVRFLAASGVTWMWLLVCVAMGWNLHTHWYDGKNPRRGNLEETLLYRRLVRAEGRAANYLASNFPSATILAPLPHSAELSWTWLNYVREPLKVEQARTASPETPVDLVYYSIVTSHDEKQLLFQAIDRQGARPIQSFLDGDVRIVILKTGENLNLQENRYAGVLISTPLAVLHSQTFDVSVAFQNLGRNVWPAPLVPTDPLGDIDVGYRWERDGQPLPDDGRRTPFQQDYFWGETAVMKLVVRAPEAPGHYVLLLDLVGPGNTWFAQLGNAPVRTDVQAY